MRLIHEDTYKDTQNAIQGCRTVAYTSVDVPAKMTLTIVPPVSDDDCTIVFVSSQNTSTNIRGRHISIVHKRTADTWHMARESSARSLNSVRTSYLAIGLRCFSIASYACRIEGAACSQAPKMPKEDMRSIRLGPAGGKITGPHLARGQPKFARFSDKALPRASLEAQ